MKDLNHLFGRISIRNKLLILTIGLATIPALCLFVFTFLLVFSELREISLGNLESEARTIRNQISANLRRFERDVRLLHRAPQLQAFVAALGTPGEAAAGRRTAQYLASLAELNEAYHQLRFIDASGRERIRVETKAGRVQVVPEHLLQDKRHRYYFQQAILRAPGEVYVSPMDYNVEHKNAETPALPVFRYAMPVMHDGIVRGIFVINIFGRIILDVLKENAAYNFESLELLDARGRSIVSGIMNGGSLQLTIDLEPGTTEGASGASRANPRTGSLFTSTERKFFVRLPINPLLDQSGDYWTLVLQGDRGKFVEPFYRFGLPSLGFLLLFSLAAVVLGLLSARHFYRPLLKLRDAARTVTKGEYGVEIAIDTNDELEDLAQDFTLMAQALRSREAEINTYQRELENLVSQRTFQIALEKEKLERVVEGVGAGLLLFDRNRQLVWHNDLESIFLDPEAVTKGASCCKLFSEQIGLCSAGGSNSDQCSIKKAFAGEHVELPLKEICPIDGNKRYFLDRIAPISDEQGHVIYALHILFDVTDTHNMEQRESSLRQQLIRAEKLATLGRFTAGIAHEVGNPLGIISANAQALQEEFPEDSVSWKQLELIQSEIQRLSKLTRDLNMFGRPSPPVLLSHNPADIVVGLKALIERDAAAHNVRIHTREQACEGTILVDAQQLQQVILNLVVNAFQAMPDGGELRLEIQPDRTRTDGARVNFTISDTGIGIPEENLETIFDPFFTTKPQGTGFGLALANTMVTQNNGEIDVASVLGEGTTFTISLPLYRESARADEPVDDIDTKVAHSGS